jgi:hypothetical protein
MFDITGTCGHHQRDVLGASVETEPEGDLIMPANIQLVPGSATLSTNSLSKSSPVDIWFSWSLSNSGDEDGDASDFGWEITHDGGTVSNGGAPPQAIPAGGTVQQGTNLPSGAFLSEGEYWASVVSYSTGTHVGGASLQVTP